MSGSMTNKFCSSCRKYKKPENGYFVKNRAGKTVRWRCADCQIRAKIRLDLPDADKLAQGDDNNKEN